MSAELAVARDRIRVSRRTNLFSTKFFMAERNDRAYDVHPDGPRFLFIRQPETTNLVVVADWFLEVREILEPDRP